MSISMRFLKCWRLWSKVNNHRSKNKCLFIPQGKKIIRLYQTDNISKATDGDERFLFSRKILKTITGST